jgi:hypothetical protein
VAVCGALPFRLSPAGICAASGEAVSWEEVRLHTVEHSLYSGTTLLGRFRTEQLAEASHKRLQQISDSPAHQRERLIRRAMRAMFDVQWARERLDEFRRDTRWPRRLANAIFLWLFIVGPVSIQLLGLGITWLPLLAGAILLLGFSVWRFVRAHRRLYPREGGARFRQTLSMALSPPAAARAPDLLLIDLFAGLHPMAVAAVVLSPREFTAYAGEMLRAIKHPLAEDLSEESQDIARWHERELLVAAEELASKCGVDIREAYAVPEAQSDSVVAWCPRCRMQYVNDAQTCADCPGVALVRYAAPVATAANRQ